MASELKIGGVTIDPAEGGLAAYRLAPYSARGGRASFEFAARTGALRAGPDPYLGQAVELYIDSTLVFAGDIDDVSEPFDSRLGWVQLYRCTDLRSRADRVPVTDPTRRLDAITFNLPSDDLDYQGSRAGRSIGAMAKYALEAPDTAARLLELGIGGFNSTGWGAAATATASGGSLTFSVTSGGSGYGTTPPNVLLVGGDGTYTSATATLTAGVVTGISASDMSGWTEAPEVWIGTLPLATLGDLSRIAFIPPGAVTVQGDYVLGAVESLLRSWEPNATLHAEPDGTIRVHDLRECAGPRVVIEGDGTGATARAVTDSTGAVVSVDVLTGGSGYTAATARAVGGGGSGATFTVNLDTGAVDTIDVDTGGSGYRYARTLTLGTDPIEPFSLQRDARGCYSRVVVRGEPEAEMIELRLSKGDLEEDFAWGSFSNEDAKTNWSLLDFEGYGRTEGTVSSCTSTTVTVDPDDAALTWGANAWDQNNRKGSVFLRETVIAGVDSLVTRRVVSNTSLSGGGTSVLTLDRALPSTSYSSFTLTGLGGGASKVWRQYRVVNSTIAQRMLQYASYPLPIRNADGSAARLSSTPVLIIQYSDGGSPPYFEGPMGVTIDPDAGTILADKPVVTLFGQRSDLITGGADTNGIPADVILYVPVNKGDQEAIVPADDASDNPQYAGTAYTDYGLERTLTTSLPMWRDPGQKGAVTDYAEAIWASLSDVPVEGAVTYRGLYADALAFPLAVNLAGDGYTTGWEDAALPVVDCELVWEEDGPDLYRTRLAVSSRRQPYSAMNFLRPEPMGDPLGAGLEGLNNGYLATEVTFGGQAPGSGFRDFADWTQTAAELGLGMGTFHRDARRPGFAEGRHFDVGPSPGAVEIQADRERARQGEAALAKWLPPVSTPDTPVATPSPAERLGPRERADRAARWQQTMGSLAESTRPPYDDQDTLFGGGG